MTDGYREKLQLNLSATATGSHDREIYENREIIRYLSLSSHERNLRVFDIETTIRFASSAIFSSAVGAWINLSKSISFSIRKKGSIGEGIRHMATFPLKWTSRIS